MVQARILIVEDEEALARLVANHLRRAGYEVRIKGEGKEGCLCVAEHWPDLVILDVMLPDMSGLEVCLEIRRLSHPWPIPVLMLTALDTATDQLRGFGHGADAYLTKPASTGELLRTVAELLSHREGASRTGDG